MIEQMIIRIWMWATEPEGIESNKEVAEVEPLRWCWPTQPLREKKEKTVTITEIHNWWTGIE